jgi:hypothetical protein
MIEVKVYSPLGVLLVRRTGSGVIFYQDASNYHVLTLYEFTSITEDQMMTIEITDYMNRTYRAYLRKDSEEFGLSGIRFSKNRTRILDHLEIAEQMPKTGEPLILNRFSKSNFKCYNNGNVNGLYIR